MSFIKSDFTTKAVCELCHSSKFKNELITVIGEIRVCQNAYSCRETQFQNLYEKGETK